jgi:1,4-alpha-glucan branching enzyme
VKEMTMANKSVELVCNAPQAKDVFVAGTFNDWNPHQERLVRNKSGQWRATLWLEPGRYEYKFIIDGVWTCSPSCEEGEPCPHCVMNAFGTMNRVLLVK